MVFQQPMAILVLHELGLYYLIDAGSLIDLFHYLGEENSNANVLKRLII